MTKISFKTLISDVTLPLSMDDYRNKWNEVTELCKAGEITVDRACGLKNMLESNASEDVKRILADERHEEMRKTAETLVKALNGDADVMNAAKQRFNDWMASIG